MKLFSRSGLGTLLRRLILVALPAVAILGFAIAPAAQAASVGYTLQSGSRTDTAIRFDGDQLVEFSMSVVPTSCPGGESISTDNSFDITLPGPVQLVNGSFQFSGRALSSYYDVGSNAGSYGADYDVSGTVSPDHRLITGSVTISDATDPFVSGCSGDFPFMAVPTVPHSTSGGIVQQHAQFVSQFVSFDYRGGVVTNLRVEAHFTCGDGVDYANVIAAAYGFPVIHVRSGRWSLSSYVLDTYGAIVTLDMTGYISGHTGRGGIKMSEPQGLTSITKDACHGDQSWRAARRTPLGPPAPQAFFNWDAVRVPFDAAYRYYFAVSDIVCGHGATDVEISVDHRSETVSCGAGQAWASGPLAPGHVYQGTATAVRVSGGRVVKRGIPVTQVLTMPGADDQWRPINTTLGPPPG